ncbi:GLPGLI family protein [Flavobacterium aurantiibacter]|uniref:GLPGLI family protein n=1 Tax=Flavobacterium aurantiibacter TaxID=2023067 RepID=A0A256ADJ1_9FLAO|nr:GLPGLI family protein [Flavobacterium aurantiibacter]OYQ51782.1 hypothetical protein CHX27_00175 [Flavobacterium aurantiibacter]
MKKFIILSSLLLLSTKILAQSSGIATYKIYLNFSPEALEADKKFLLLRNAEAAAKDVRFELRFNAERSNFNEVENASIDKVTLNTIRSLAGADKLIAIDNKDKKILIEVKENKLLFDKNEFVIEEPLAFKWNISTEVKQIGKYKCFKATTTKDVDLGTRIVTETVTAYFCPEIPVPYGPGIYGSLPGLIIELQEKNSAFVLEEIKFRNIEDSEFVIPKGRTVLSRKQYIDVVNKRFETLKELSKQ